MDTNNDGIIDDPLATGKKMGRPYSPLSLEERKKIYNERHKAWSKGVTIRKRREAIKQLLTLLNVNVPDESIESAIKDSSLVIYFKKG